MRSDVGWLRSPAWQGAWIGGLGVLAVAAYAELLIRLGLSEPALATVAAVCVAAVLSSVAGFAFSAICGAMIFHFRHDTVVVVQIMLICSIANQALSVLLLRRDIQARALVPFVAGGLLGVPSGTWLLLHLNAGAYLATLGAILLVYGGYMLVRPPFVVRRSPMILDILAGLAGGLTGGFAATPGAPVSIWCGTKGWDKVRQRAVFQHFILLMQIVALASIALMSGHGASGRGIPDLAWLCVPLSLVGTWCSLACFRRMTDRQFTISINLLLIASGLAMMV